DPNATELEVDADGENAKTPADETAGAENASDAADPLAPTITVRPSSPTEKAEDAEENADSTDADKPFDLGPRVLDDETLEKNDQEGDDFFSGDLFGDDPIDEGGEDGKKADAPKTPSKK
ncbi:MAG: hypothetical protein IIW01_09385, partial [Thermoguttaceae bacterium]|nr:hypothetical protein [Thermoguttaceae bacterium]